MATGNFSFLQMELTYNETKVGTCPALLCYNIHCTMYLHYTTDIFSGARIECTLYLPLGLQIDYGFTIRSLYRYFTRTKSDEFYQGFEWVIQI